MSMKAALVLALACNIALTASLPASLSYLSSNPYLQYLDWAASHPSANYEDLDLEDNADTLQQNFPPLGHMDHMDHLPVDQDRSDEDVVKRSNSKWNMRMFKKSNVNKWQQRLFKRPDKWQQRMFKRPNSNKWEMRMFKRASEPWKMRMFKREADVSEEMNEK